MIRLRRRVVVFLLLALISAAGISVWRTRRAPTPGPLALGIWYWHTPFKLPAAEVRELKAMGVSELFVRAGTFRADGSALRLVLPQRWESRAEGVAVHLVFNFDYGIVRSYASFDNAAIERAVMRAVADARDQAQKAGLRVAGVQLDFDCPTRRLPKYAELLRGLRRELKPLRLALSITALQSWFRHGDVRQVMEAVDFTAPQYYEAELPKSLDRVAPISNLERMREGLRAAGRTGLPFRAGLPAYGHATVYDRAGRLVGMFRDMGLDDIARRPEFRPVRSYACDAKGQPAAGAGIGEEMHEYVADVAATDTGQTGYHIVFDLPTPELVRQHVAALRAERPAKCGGVILFRYPEPGEASTLPLRSLAAAWHGQRAAPDVRVKLRAASAPWELIDTGKTAARPPVDLAVIATNAGTASTYLRKDGVVVWVALDRPGAESVEPGVAAQVETYYRAGLRPGGACGEAGMRSSARRANVFRFSCLRIGAGESVRLGVIRLPADGAEQAWGEWSAAAPGGGGDLHGVVAPMRGLEGAAR